MRYSNNTQVAMVYSERLYSYMYIYLSINTYFLDSNVLGLITTRLHGPQLIMSIVGGNKPTEIIN